MNTFAYILMAIVFCVSAYVPHLHRKSLVSRILICVITPLILSVVYALAATGLESGYVVITVMGTAVFFGGASLIGGLIGIATAALVAVKVEGDGNGK